MLEFGYASKTLNVSRLFSYFFLYMYVQYALCFLKPRHLLIITDKTLAQSLMCMPLLNLKLIPEPMTEIEKITGKN